MKAGLSGGLEKERFAIGCDEMAIADHFSYSARPPMQQRISLAWFRRSNHANNAKRLLGQALPAERFRRRCWWPDLGLCDLDEPSWRGCDWAIPDDAINMAVWVDAGRGDNATAVPSDIDVRRDPRGAIGDFLRRPKVGVPAPCSLDCECLLATEATAFFSEPLLSVQSVKINDKITIACC
jgi:hypothetical protein